MKFKTYKTKDPERFRVDTEYHTGYRQITIEIKVWFFVLILVTVVLGLLVLFM
jgi:hypothetical protein